MAEIVLAVERLCPVERVAEFVTSGGPFSPHRPERLWAGGSGDIVTGAEAAEHLEATLALLESKSWVRNYGPSDDEPEEMDESASIPDMLRRIIRLLSWSRPGYTLTSAMYEISNSERGDSDTHYVAGSCMDAVLAAQSPTGRGYYGAWADRQGRTFADVRGLLVTAAEFARQYGPKDGE